jgi:hypothetical protein
MSAPEKTERPPPGNVYVPYYMIVFLFVLSGALAVLVLYSLVTWWPEAVKAGPNAGETSRASQSVAWLWWEGNVQRETLFFVVVALGGMLGGLVHTFRSLSWYVGNRNLLWSWVPFNLMLPVVGALGGTIFYVVLRAGLFSPSGSAEEASPFGFTAVAMLVGLFSEEAMEKLRQIAANVFAERPAGEDHVDPVETKTTTEA